MRKGRNSVFALACICLLMHCGKPVPLNVTPAFYHWRTTFNPSAEAISLAEDIGTKRIYLRLFDIDWDESTKAPAPLAYLSAGQPLHELDVEWVPTVFITNRSLQELPIQEAEHFANRLLDKIFEQTESLKLRTVPEIQMDCDWSQSTKEVYFSVLKTCKARLAKDNIRLSATIRLHQLRYPDKTGVPPVDRGMLMYYNMGEVRQWEEPNSILNTDAAVPYLQATAYPLPLDLALPAFQWGVLFREGAMIRLLNGLSASDLADPERFYNMQGGRYEVVSGTFLDGHYLYEGDLIRLETVTQEALEVSINQLKGFKWTGEVFLTFYELNSAPELELDATALDAMIKAFEGD